MYPEYNLCFLKGDLKNIFGSISGGARMNFISKEKIISKYKSERVSRIVCWLILLVLLFVYFGVYWNRTIPYTEAGGLIYSELISLGKVPYRDFYYYLPPLNLLMDWAIWKMSFQLIILYRVWRWVERLIMGTLMYQILLRVTKPAYACIATFLGSVLGAATVFDLLGDYNQTCDLLVLIAIKILIKYADVFGKDDKAEKRNLFLLGIVIGFAFLLKQTIFLSISSLYFFVLTYFFVINRKRQYLYNVVTVICGAILPILVPLIYFLYNGALDQFIRQVYLDVDSKGSIFNILLAFPRVILNYRNVIVVLIAIMSFVCLVWIQKQPYTTKNKNIVLISIVFNFISVYYLMYYNEIVSFMQIEHWNDLIYIAIICIVCVSLYIFKERFTYHFRYGITISCLIMLILFVFTHEDLAYSLYMDTSVFNLIDGLPMLTSLLGVVVYGILLYKYREKTEKMIFIHLVILTGALSSVIAEAMTATDRIPNIAMRILIPYLSVYILSLKTYGERVKEAVAIVALCGICVICTSQKVASAYSWWGWQEEVISKNSNYSINVNGLEGFRTNENVKNMYEEIVHVLKDNTDTTSVIYGFPHIKIFNILCENYNMNSFIPVPFYDVCSDKYAREDAKLLQRNPPDIVIWCDMPSCMEVHEAIFRGGDALGQRDIQRWLSEAVAREEYIMIAQYDSLFVYKKVSDAPIGYTYFKSDRALNSTLNTAESLGIVTDFFEGKGTEEEPFLIKTEDEFDKFRFLVNSGCQFKDCFFQQEKDLHFDKDEIHSSIGKCSDGTCFLGCYDGKNHVISGLNIQENSDSGIFGILGGTVKNLTVKDSVIKGHTAAGMAAHALSPSAVIINCTVEDDVEVYGERAGGIVDDFLGGVINCKSNAQTYATSEYMGEIYGFRVGYMVGTDEN